MRTLPRLLAATAAASLALLTSAAPAEAHDIRKYGPYECGRDDAEACGYGQVRGDSVLDIDHVIVDACDTVADGFGYYVRYRLFHGSQGKVGDGNGSAAGCGIRHVGTFWDPVVEFSMCSDRALVDYCTPWYLA